MKRILTALSSLFITAPLTVLGQEKIDVLPASAFDRSMIYVDLALFWIALLVLIVLIRLKLREIERIQAMEQTVKDEKVPLLE